MVSKIYQSPNFDERNTPISMIVLHYTGMKTGKEAIERLCFAEAKVSSHYVLEENGDLYQLVEESKRAWHAGISCWRGINNVNANSIGIEIVNTGHEFGYVPFTEAQYKRLIPLCQQIKARYDIEDVNIVGHSDVAPERKEDPGELFDWKRLAENGLGLWPITKQLSNSATKQLTDLGYKTHDKASITAFQRHWRQSKVDGIWDNECENILLNLLQLI